MLGVRIGGPPRAQHDGRLPRPRSAASPSRPQVRRWCRRPPVQYSAMVSLVARARANGRRSAGGAAHHAARRVQAAFSTRGRLNGHTRVHVGATQAFLVLHCATSERGWNASREARGGGGAEAARPGSDDTEEAVAARRMAPRLVDPPELASAASHSAAATPSNRRRTLAHAQIERQPSTPDLAPRCPSIASAVDPGVGAPRRRLSSPSAVSCAGASEDHDAAAQDAVAGVRRFGAHRSRPAGIKATTTSSQQQARHSSPRCHARAPPRPRTPRTEVEPENR